MAGEAATDRPFQKLKDPRYTGENRCRPCTVLNVAIAAIGSVLLAAWFGGASSFELLIAIVAFAGACGVIYFRGYLVPGTPTITERYVPGWLLARIGAPDGHESTTAVDPETLLLDLGIVVETEDGSDLTLDDAFATAWIEAVDDFAATTEEMRLQLADALGVEPAGLDLKRRRNSFDARHDDVAFARWESKAACQADVAAAAIMPLFDADWGRRSFQVRSELLGALRLFLDVCPTCRGPVSLGHEVVRSCCSQRDVVAATCDGCNARVFEVAVDVDRLSTERAARPR